MELTTATEEELYRLHYELLAQFEQMQVNLRLLNEEIHKRRLKSPSDGVPKTPGIPDVVAPF